MYALMHVCALMYVRTNVKSDGTIQIYIIYIYIYNIYIIIYTYISERMDQRYVTDPSHRYGTDVWNGGMERVWSRTLFQTL